MEIRQARKLMLTMHTPVASSADSRSIMEAGYHNPITDSITFVFHSVQVGDRDANFREHTTAGYAVERMRMPVVAQRPDRAQPRNAAANFS